MNATQNVERSIITTYRKKIWRQFVDAVKEYQLIEDGDRIAVCISGGKDSMLMAKCFQELKRHGKDNFSLEFLVMDPGYHTENRAQILENAEKLGIPVTVFESDIFDVVDRIDDNPCYLCARMRRGFLYSKAKELGCNKIALGHHFDDVVETILMGMLYNGQIQSMMPKLKSKNFEGMELIRPMYHVKERDIVAWRNLNGLSFLQCACKLTARIHNSLDGIGESKRQEMKALVKELVKTNPQADDHIFNSVKNINLNTVISVKRDGKLYHFLDEY